MRQRPMFRGLSSRRVMFQALMMRTPKLRRSQFLKILRRKEQFCGQPRRPRTAAARQLQRPTLSLCHLPSGMCTGAKLAVFPFPRDARSVWTAKKKNGAVCQFSLRRKRSNFQSLPRRPLRCCRLRLPTPPPFGASAQPQLARYCKQVRPATNCGLPIL